jgi:hypothetical protein
MNAFLVALSENALTLDSFVRSKKMVTGAEVEGCEVNSSSKSEDESARC